MKFIFTIFLITLFILPVIGFVDGLGYKKNDNEFLDFISKNARKWYLDNLSFPNITNNLIKLLKL
jgi:hypothetical protein